jgi:ATP phosphoribosyltransferase
MKHPSSERTVLPLDWSADGSRLLAQVGGGPEPTRAVVITAATGAVKTLPLEFDDVVDFSRNGKRVLGIVGGDVVSVRLDGATRVLARNANSPSWNR